MYNKEEKDMITALQEKQMWDECRPVVAAIIKNGGGSAQALIKKSEIFAAAALLDALKSKKDDVRLKAAIELLNRSAGKPVERRIDIYADFSQMSESEIDNQIKTLMNQVGETAAIDGALQQIPKMLNKKRKTLKQARRKAKDFTVDEGTYETAKGTASQIVEAEGSAQTRNEAGDL